MYARNACSESLVTRPFHTSVHRASTEIVGVASTDGDVQRREKRRALGGEIVEHAALEISGLLGGARRRPQQSQVVGQEQRQTTVAFAQGLEASPGDLAGRDEPIEIGGVVVLDARRQDLALKRRGDQRRALQLLDAVEQRVEAPTLARHALPGHRQPAQCFGLDRLDLLAQPRQRALAQGPQHVDAAPLALDAAGPELALQHTPGGGQPRQQLLHDRRRSGRSDSRTWQR